MRSLPRVQLDMEKKRKLITLDRLSGKEGRSSTKETESKMFAFLPDVDLDIEILCARKSRKIREEKPSLLPRVDMGGLAPQLVRALVGSSRN